jgi:hypothetical protein
MLFTTLLHILPTDLVATITITNMASALQHQHTPAQHHDQMAHCLRDDLYRQAGCPRNVGHYPALCGFLFAACLTNFWVLYLQNTY